MLKKKDFEERNEMTFKDFCAADDNAVVSSLLDDAEITKEVCQKTIENSDADSHKKNEIFELIYPTIAISSLLIVRKFSISKCLC